MAGMLSAIKTWSGTAFGNFRRITSDPFEVEGGSALTMGPSYRLLWSYYANDAFENVGAWGAYKGQYRLYRQMRLLYNPTRRLCDFYATHLYPGALTAIPASMPEGTPMAIPLADDTDPAMRAALNQLWAWSRWQANKSVLCRYGAVAGSVLIETVDDLDAGRVYLNIVWPSLVSYLDLDPTGEVIGYALEYPTRDENNSLYQYRKEVDRQTISFYRDGQPHDYGEGISYPNPYGFVPAVWIKHKDLGGNVGAPAIHGSIGKIDELNSLASHIHDQIHKVIGAPILIGTSGKIGSLFGNTAQTKRPGSNPYDPTDLDREGVLMLTGPADTRVDSLAGELQLHEAAEHMTMLQTEIEADHPEMAMYRELRAMSQVTGPAATRLMGDVVATVDEVAANYDAGCQHAFSMALAIGGWRAGSGAWGPLSPAQATFRPFGLEQYAADELRVRIMPRQLVPQTELERLEVERRKVALQIDQKAAATDLTQVAADLQTAAESNVVRSVIPRSG